MFHTGILSIFLVLLLGLAPIAQASCAPPLTGSPCTQGGLATLHDTEPSLNLGAGNPIHLVTGNNYQLERDLPTSLGLLGLELVRHYNALNPQSGVLGTGWVLSYETRLYRVNQQWQIVQADGSRIRIPTLSEPNKKPMPLQGRLERGPSGYRWHWPGGAMLQFDHDGRLTAIHQPGNATVLIHRYSSNHATLGGQIRYVINAHEQVMHFHYTRRDGQTRLKRVITPLGEFSYEYDHALRLVSVTRPDGMQRRYLYESERQAGQAHLLTGVALAEGKHAPSHRINTWEYDHHGRAIYASRGALAHPHSQVRLHYEQTPSPEHPGLTLVRNARGQVTRFHTAIRGAKYVLTAVDGHGCPGCAKPGTHAQYDASGRILKINHLSLKRDHQGKLRQLNAKQGEWPGLRLHFDTTGRRTHWHSYLTGMEHMLYDQRGAPTKRVFANGDTQTFLYDVQGRPQQWVANHHGQQLATTLRWHGHRLIQLEHPKESQQRDYDPSGRLTAITVHRHCPEQPACLSYRESFAYDHHGRLTHHQLPEGGQLHYEWGVGTHLTAVYWTDAQGHRHPIIQTQLNRPGYRYGNQLHLHTEADARGRVRRLALTSGPRTLLEHHMDVDVHQRVRGERIRSSLPDLRRASTSLHEHRSRYDYDERDRLIISQTQTHAQQHTPFLTWLAWQDGGAAAARRDNQHTRRPHIRWDASGLPVMVDGNQLEYGAHRRLARVRRNGQLVASYQYNAFGQRISRTLPPSSSATARHRQFFYVDHQLVAESDIDPTRTPMSAEDFSVTRRYVYAHHAPIAMITYSASHPTGRLDFIHADLTGTPRLVTDTYQNIRWQADYTVLGQAINTRGDITLDLRMPGQVFDAATGWHDNLTRTYHPEWGHYLEADPLGPLPTSQVFGYAAQQPRRFIDPLGLLLFAFDGTRQSERTQGNVWKLSQHYLDGPVYYHPGPGNSDHLDWDAITANKAQDIIDTQWAALLAELAATDIDETIPIDILGFSRGAALARHFGNLVASYVSQDLFEFDHAELGTITACVDLRFMGLFDSVAQFGLVGTRNYHYDLTVPAAWEWVAHATALHEHRVLFPLLSATEGGHASFNVIQAPFVGAHSNIGGGILPAERSASGPHSDLSNVALNWMLWQARAAAVRFSPLDTEDRTIDHPILYDHRAKLFRRARVGDRAVQSPDGQRHLMWQSDHPTLGKLQRQQTETFIERPEGWPNVDGNQAGWVDMDGYARWLHDELGWQPPPV